jgi:hypothetical protein
MGIVSITLLLTIIFMPKEGIILEKKTKNTANANKTATEAILICLFIRFLFLILVC